ncbi:MAG: cyanophycinase [Alphaproteobacteria bacterium]|nr:cyanophycinase [Alphaproteobacteria bacterium]HPF47243.1 cyanophycinase [Emcibacteraceae bacterium]
MCPAIVEEGHQRGYIIPIGGAENKDTNPSILKKFTEISGGKNAKIVIIPTASRLDDTGERYEKIFSEIGAGEVSHIDITSREDCNNPEFASRCEEATGIFITGGNQLRLATILGGTAVAQVIRTANARGVHVAGTSAGASIMSEHMIAGGESNESPREGGAILAPGLGLTNAMIIDQHFSERNRLGRLLSAIAFNPFLMGMGIDEDTAAFIGPDDMCEVIGSGTVTIVDGVDLTYSSAYGTDNTKALGLLGLKLDILHEGCLYNFDIREAFPPIEDRQNVCKI